MDLKSTSLHSLLDRHIRTLSLAIGERHDKKPQALERARVYIREQLTATGLPVEEQIYDFEGATFANIVATLRGSDLEDQVIVVGAHYDTEYGTPGANDNGSGIAATLAMAHDLAGYKSRRTIVFVAFANEEARYFGTDGMGSQVYAKKLKAAGIRVHAMFSLETMGYFTAGAGSQKLPAELEGRGLPDEGNFLAFIANPGSKDILDETVDFFRLFSAVPALGMALDPTLPGVSLSDHRSFWQQNYPGIMVTDTAPFRYPWYHSPLDTPDKINMKVYRDAVLGLTATIAALAGKQV